MCSPKVESLRYHKRIYKNTVLCSFFAENCCTRGENCTFAHGDENRQDAPDLKKTALCRDFQQKLCLKSSTECDFAHSSEELRHWKVRDGQPGRGRHRKRSGAAVSAGSSEPTEAAAFYPQVNVAAWPAVWPHMPVIPGYVPPPTMQPTPVCWGPVGPAMPYPYAHAAYAEAMAAASSHMYEGRDAANLASSEFYEDLEAEDTEEPGETDKTDNADWRGADFYAPVSTDAGETGTSVNSWTSSPEEDDAETPAQQVERLLACLLDVGAPLPGGDSKQEKQASKPISAESTEPSLEDEALLVSLFSEGVPPGRCSTAATSPAPPGGQEVLQ